MTYMYFIGNQPANALPAERQTAPFRKRSGRNRALFKRQRSAETEDLPAVPMDEEAFSGLGQALFEHEDIGPISDKIGTSNSTVATLGAFNRPTTVYSPEFPVSGCGALKCWPPKSATQAGRFDTLSGGGILAAKIRVRSGCLDECDLHLSCNH